MKREKMNHKLAQVGMLFATAFAVAMVLFQTNAMAATKISNVTFTGVTEPASGKALTFDIQSPAGAPYEATTMKWYEMPANAKDPLEEICGYASNDTSGYLDLLGYDKPEIKTFSKGKIYLLSIEFDVKDGYELTEDFTCTVNGQKAAGQKGEDLVVMKVANTVMISYGLDNSGKLSYGEIELGADDTSSKTPSTTTPSKTPSKKTGTKTTTVKLSTGKLTKLSPAKKKIVVKWTKDKSANAYEIQYSLKSNMKSAKTVTVKGASKSSTTIKGLKSKKTYYVRVRNVNGKTKGSWSKVLKAKVK